MSLSVSSSWCTKDRKLQVSGSTHESDFSRARERYIKQILKQWAFLELFFDLSHWEPSEFPAFKYPTWLSARLCLQGHVGALGQNRTVCAEKTSFFLHILEHEQNWTDLFFFFLLQKLIFFFFCFKSNFFSLVSSLLYPWRACGWLREVALCNRKTGFWSQAKPGLKYQPSCQLRQFL